MARETTTDLYSVSRKGDVLRPHGEETSFDRFPLAINFYSRKTIFCPLLPPPPSSPLPAHAVRYQSVGSLPLGRRVVFISASLDSIG